MGKKGRDKIKGAIGQKIVNLGIAPLVISLHNKGYSIHRIAVYLKKMGYEVAPQTIQKFLQLKDLWADLRWEEIVDSLDKSANKVIKERKSALDKFYETLEQVEKNIETLNKSQTGSNNKILLKDRLLRTKVLTLNSIAKLETSLIKRQLLRRIFQDLTTEFVKMFNQLDINDDDVKGAIAVILNRVYKKYENEL